jgi:Alpha/beta hydrolase domain
MSLTSASKLTGPIEVSAASLPFRGVGVAPAPGPGLPPPDLHAAGYAEEEYFITGEAEGVSYATALLVRKPRDPNTFSGVVLVETMHAAGATPMWGVARELLAQGHAYAMVVSQKVALDAHVKPFAPSRYAALDISVPGGAAPGDRPPPAAFSAELMSEIERLEPVSNAIMSQAGVLLKRNSPAGPFAGMQVKHLIMGGSSQTGGTTLRYIRDAHASARLGDGSPIYGGYLAMESGGTEPVGRRDVPVIHALGEGDIMGGRPLGYRRPDSDDPSDRFRLYEFTGSSHVPTRGVKSAAEMFPLLEDASSSDDTLSQFPSAMFYNTALHNLIQWVDKGVTPPRGDRIKTGEDGEIVRDEHGNARGGVRLSYIEVPFATYIARAPGGDMFRGMIGLEVPFPKQKLLDLYGTHDRYVAHVKECLDQLVAQGWILPEYADELRAEAEQSDIP